jgi:hypothetical protein
MRSAGSKVSGAGALGAGDAGERPGPMIHCAGPARVREIAMPINASVARCRGDLFGV